MSLDETPQPEDLSAIAEALLKAREAEAAATQPPKPPTLKEVQAEIIRADAARKVEAMQSNMM